MTLGEARSLHKAIMSCYEDEFPSPDRLTTNNVENEVARKRKRERFSCRVWCMLWNSHAVKYGERKLVLADELKKYPEMWSYTEPGSGDGFG